jgi:hypothetical protein
MAFFFIKGLTPAIGTTEIAAVGKYQVIEQKILIIN